MRIALISSEAVPFSKTGGLADVAGTLFKEYIRMGLNASLFVPLYKTTIERFHNRLTDLELQIDIPMGKEVKKCKVFSEKRLGKENEGECAVYFVANNEYFDRPNCTVLRKVIMRTTTRASPFSARAFSKYAKVSICDAMCCIAMTGRPGSFPSISRRSTEMILYSEIHAQY